MLFRLGAATFNDVIYVVGGVSTGNQPQAKVYYSAADPNSGLLTGWAETNALPEARFYHKVTVHDGRLVTVGGKKDENTESAQVYSAAINSNGELEMWKAEPALPESRYRFAAVGPFL
ncbi:MAG: hypothetical protein ACOYNY_27480 [Caldilineaceae bacterium]